MSFTTERHGPVATTTVCTCPSACAVHGKRGTVTRSVEVGEVCNCRAVDPRYHADWCKAKVRVCDTPDCLSPPAGDSTLCRPCQDKRLAEFSA